MSEEELYDHYAQILSEGQSSEHYFTRHSYKKTEPDGKFHAYKCSAMPISFDSVTFAKEARKDGFTVQVTRLNKREKFVTLTKRK